MDYTIYKLEFRTGVHFGNGMLNDSVYTFRADTLFSALYIEALKHGVSEQLRKQVVSGNLLFSDAFPYVGNQYMIPKPMLYIEPSDKGDSSAKKKYKKLKYLPVERLEEYLAGSMKLDENPMHGFGLEELRTMAAVRKEEDTLPFHVGTYYYNRGNGLYIIVGYQTEDVRVLAEELLKGVALAGIGGKRASGLGKFDLRRGEDSQELFHHLNKKADCYMLLSAALPIEKDMEHALEGASYLLEKRSGFIASDTYADEPRKKKDVYVFSAGSCFKHVFCGDLIDVSDGGRHPVYRYAVPLFMGV